MSDNSFWITEIENKISQYITNNFSEEIKAEFPSLEFVTDEEKLGTASFPVVYMHLLPMAEVGADLEGKTINAVKTTYEVQVFSQTSKDVSNIIMWHILALMKKKSFTISSMPNTIKDQGLYRSIARMTRVIGSGDTI